MAELETVIGAYTAAIDRFCALLRQGRADMTIPHLEWNVGELGSHILAGTRAYKLAAEDGVPAWNDTRSGPAENARLMAATAERDTEVLAKEIPASAARLCDAWRAHEGRSIRWIADIDLPVETVAGIQLSDVLVHGWDLSRALRQRWTIPRDQAVLGIEASFQIAPHFVAPAAKGFTGTYDVRIRGDGRYVLAFNDGALTLGGNGGKIDCRLNADAATFLLAAYGRVPTWRAAITGKVVATGRKPWLGFKFKSLLLNP